MLDKHVLKSFHINFCSFLFEQKIHQAHKRKTCSTGNKDSLTAIDSYNVGMNSLCKVHQW